MQPGRRLVWLAVDVFSVLLFSALGRRSHAEGVTLTGVATTAWPFLSGTLVGWLVSRAWRRPTAVAPTGVIVWLSTAVVGMLLRKASSASVAAAFIGVASVVTAVLLLGWRAVVGLAQSRRARGGINSR